MIQYPKNEHMTLPSVEGWGTNLNILRDPPKSITTRRVDKVGETSRITEWIGDDGGDRICEVIKPYARGVNPFVSVSYSNYGTNGGQMRQANGSSSSKSTIKGGQAYLPYRIARDGAFRPPILGPRDLLPLSRLPRVWTQATTNPDFPNYAKKINCPAPETMRQIKKDECTIKTTVRPTAIYNIEVPHQKTYDIKNVITNPVQYTAHSRVKGMETQMQKVQVPVHNIHDRLNTSVSTHLGTNSKVKHSIETRVNPERYIKDDSLNYTRTTNLSGIEKESRLKGQVDLERNLPIYNARTNITSNEVYKKAIDNTDLNLDRKLPQAHAQTNPGHGRTGSYGHQNSATDIKIRDRLSSFGSFDNFGTKPTLERTNMPIHHHIDQQRKKLSEKVTQQFESRYN